MKKNLLFVLLLLVYSLTAYPQVPDAFNYQAVLRNASGELISNQDVSFKISILQDSESGTPVYVETHFIATNDFGIANLKIGQGTLLSGAFDPAAWGLNLHFLKLEIDEEGGSSYAHMGTSQLLSVPYAFHAQTVAEDQVDDADADATNELQTLSLSGTELSLSDGGGTVDIADKQTLAISGNELSISDGNTISIPDMADNWGTQAVMSDASLSGNGTTANPLSVEGDLTDNQTLSVSGNDLSISDGNTITLPTGSESPWIKSGSDIYYNTGKVSIGSTTPNTNGILTVYGQTNSSFLSFNNNATGNTLNDGFVIGPTASNHAVYVWNFENKPIIFATNNTPQLTINEEGKVSIGTTTPNTNGILTVHGQANSSFLSLNNNATGNTLNDGFVIGPTATNHAVYLWNFENKPIIFSTNNTARMTIAANGYVGIGTESPSAGFHLKNTGYPGSFMYLEASAGNDAGIRLYEGTTAKWHIFNNVGSEGLQIYNSEGKTAIFAKQLNSFVGIGTTAPTQALHVVGNAYKTEGGTSWATSSDLRLKNLKGNYTKGLKEITALQAVKYQYKENNPRQLNSTDLQVGFVAQEVEKIFPEAVSEAEDGYLDFNIHPINVALVNAIKELKIENENLKTKVISLEARLAEIEMLLKK